MENHLVNKTCSGVYVITNPKGRVYVGSSVNVERRFKQYKYLKKNEQHKIRNSILKYGYEKHMFEVVEYCDVKTMLSRERFHCIRLDVLNEKNLNLRIPLKGEDYNSFSSDVLKKMSSIHKGKKLSKEHKKKLLDSVKGKKQSDKHINSRKMFGVNNPAFGKDGNFKGKEHSESSKLKMSKKRKNKNLLGQNSNAKKVINILTNEVFSCAKEVALKENINYSTFKSWLISDNKNKTKYRYL